MGDWKPLEDFAGLGTSGREFYVTPEDAPVPKEEDKANATFVKIKPGYKITLAGGTSSLVTADTSFGSNISINGKPYDVYYRATSVSTAGRRKTLRGKKLRKRTMKRLPRRK